MIVLGEGDFDVHLVPLLGADELILEAGDEAAAAEGQVIVLSAAAVELDSVHGADKVDVDDVAILCRLVDVDDARLLVAGVLHLLIHLLGGDFLHLSLEGETLIFAQLDLGTHRGGEHEGHAAVLLEIEGLEFGLRDDLDVVLLVESLGVHLGDNDVHRVLEKYLSAVHPLDDLHGDVSLSEPGDGIFVLGLVVSGDDRFAERFRIHVKGELDAALFQLLDCVTHLSSVYAALRRNKCTDFIVSKRKYIITARERQ